MFVGAVGVKQMLGVKGALNALLEKIGLMDPAAPIDWLGEGRFWGIFSVCRPFGRGAVPSFERPSKAFDNRNTAVEITSMTATSA